MKIKIGLILIGTVAGAMSLQASTATLDVTNAPDGAISPYTGTLTNTLGTPSSVQLYCDDPVDEAHLNSTYNIVVNSLAGAAGGDGRWASDPAKSFNTSYGYYQGTNLPPNSTDLYEELAWLYAQIGDTVSGESSSTLNTDVQDAAWALTSSADSEGQETSDAKAWINLAYQSIVTDGGGTTQADQLHGADTVTSGVSVTLQTTNLSDWFVVDAAGGLPTYDSAGTTWQEFLEYGNAGGGGSATPEPATFGLIGGALLFGGLFARRKPAAK